MHTIVHRAVLALSATLILTCAHAQQAAPELGRWITESGNLEVDIAPCGDAHCGTITRIIANNANNAMGAMNGSAAMAAAPASATAAASAPAAAVGKQILFGLKPLAAGGWQGQIYNRANNQTYNSRIDAIDANQLKVAIYDTTPAEGQVQVWRRVISTDRGSAN